MSRHSEVLDDPAWSALARAHSGLARRSGRAARYPAEVGPFAALAAADREALAELTALVPEGDAVALFAGADALDGARWQVLQRIELVQMVCDAPVAPPARMPVALSSADVPAMLALVERTRPGPFGPRTHELGSYVGFRDGAGLRAMGGERLRPAGHTELSGICTDPDTRGRGLAEAIVRALASAVQARGERPFLHVVRGSASEAAARRLYERLGFAERRTLELTIVLRRPVPT